MIHHGTIELLTKHPDYNKTLAKVQAKLKASAAVIDEQTTFWDSVNNCRVQRIRYHQEIIPANVKSRYAGPKELRA